MKKEELLKANLFETLTLFRSAVESLSYSCVKCSKIGLKEKYDLEELESFESLTSRFSRVSDILIQKIFKNIDELELESDGSILDRINRAEKRGLINSSENLRQIREIRNEIAHEYRISNLVGIFSDVLKFSPDLLSSLEKLEVFVKKYK